MCLRKNCTINNLITPPTLDNGLAALDIFTDFTVNLRCNSHKLEIWSKHVFIRVVFPQVLVIERKNEDGTWPRQASHPK